MIYHATSRASGVVCRKQKGFALLIAVILMSVMLAFGLALGSFSFKQINLFSDAVNSQYSFYIADAALECALRADQQDFLFNHDDTNIPYPPPEKIVQCGNYPSEVLTTTLFSSSPNTWQFSGKMDFIDEKLCAKITVIKPPIGVTTEMTYIFSEGFNAPCADVDGGKRRIISRGLSASY